MKLACDYIQSISAFSLCGNKGVRAELENVDYYSLYVDNDMDKILDQIPTEELEEYLSKRKENETK